MQQNLGDSIYTRAHHKPLLPELNIQRKGRRQSKTNCAQNLVAPTNRSRDMPSHTKIRK